MPSLREVKLTVQVVRVACDITAEFGDYLMLRDDGQGSLVIIGKYDAVPIEADKAPAKEPSMPRQAVSREAFMMECETVARILSVTDRAMTPTQLGRALATRLQRDAPPPAHAMQKRLSQLVKDGTIHQRGHGFYKFGPPSPVEEFPPDRETARALAN